MGKPRPPYQFAVETFNKMTSAPDEDSTCLQTPIKRKDRKLRVMHRTQKVHKWKGKMPLQLHQLQVARYFGTKGKGRAGGCKIPSDTSTGRLQSTERSKMKQSGGNNLPKKRKKGSGRDQAGGNNIPSDTSKGKDQPEKRFERDHLDGSTLPKKQKKGKTIIRQKSSTRRKTKKLPVVQRQHFVRKCKEKVHSRLQESIIARHYVGQAGGSKIPSDSSNRTDQSRECSGMDQTERSKLPKRQKKGTASKYKALENKLQLAIQDLNEDKCKSLMIDSPERELLPVLCSAFQEALLTDNDGIKEVVFSQIAKYSADVIKKFRKSSNSLPENAIIWMGTECICNKKNIKRYKDFPCFNTLPVIVVEMNESEAKFDNFEKFFGFPIRVQDLNADESEVNEAKTVLNKTVGKSDGCIVKHEIHESIAKYLFQRHCNLTMICPSKWKSTGFEVNQKREHKIEKIDCINLFCKIKGIVPVGEHHLPQKIQGIPTDVLKGSSYLSSGKLKIGDTINNDKGTGTLGGFVKYYGTDTFLTCAHVIFGTDQLLDLQKEDIHFNCRKMTSDGPLPVECTLIRHALKHDTVIEYNESTEIEEMEIEEPNYFTQFQRKVVRETSIDAALLLIQIPTNSPNKMVTLDLMLKDSVSSTEENLKLMGIKSIYLNENALPNPDVIEQKAVAISAITGDQRKAIKTKKVEEVVIRCSTHVRLPNKIQMYNQLTIENMDFQPGDSGTCIYAICPLEKDSGSIGMFIGQSTSGQFVVTPMNEILKALGVD